MVFLPGLDGTGKLFAPQAAKLSPYFDVRYLSIPEANRQDWNELAETVVTLLSREQHARPLYLCGESFGGCLALQIALNVPELLTKLVLVNPASAFCRQSWSRWMPQAAESIPEWLYNISGSVAFSLLANFDRIGGYWQRVFVDTVRPISRECVVWRLMMLQHFQLSTDRLQQLIVPTALLASRCDRLLPSYQEADYLKQFLPDAVVYRLPDSGHVCLLEDGVDLAQCLRVLDFLPESSSVRV